MKDIKLSKINQIEKYKNYKKMDFRDTILKNDFFRLDEKVIGLGNHDYIISNNKEKTFMTFYSESPFGKNFIERYKMIEREKIISILNTISNNELTDFFYSLTINFENIIHRFQNEKADIHEIKKIINNYEYEIKSFNLSFTNVGEYSDKRYKTYFYNVEFIFHSKGIVFDFSSNYLSNRQIDISNIDKLFEVYSEHKKSSKRLYNVIKLK